VHARNRLVNVTVISSK